MFLNVQLETYWLSACSCAISAVKLDQFRQFRLSKSEQTVEDDNRQPITQREHVFSHPRGLVLGFGRVGHPV